MTHLQTVIFGQSLRERYSKDNFQNWAADTRYVVDGKEKQGGKYYKQCMALRGLKDWKKWQNEPIEIPTLGTSILPVSFLLDYKAILIDL